MSPTPPHASRRTPYEGNGPRERLCRALRDLHPSSPWRDVLSTALQAMDGPARERDRALSWLHYAISFRLPADPQRDTMEHRVLRRALSAIDDELDADDVGRRAA